MIDTHTHYFLKDFDQDRYVMLEKLREAGMEVVFQDERLSTVSAHQALIEGGMRRDGRKGVVDKVAAAVILQQYLDSARRDGAE